jgi:hypothetical protein
MVRNIYVCNYLQRVRIGFATLLKYMYINISYFYSPTKNFHQFFHFVFKLLSPVFWKWAVHWTWTSIDDQLLSITCHTLSDLYCNKAKQTRSNKDSLLFFLTVRARGQKRPILSLWLITSVTIRSLQNYVQYKSERVWQVIERSWSSIDVHICIYIYVGVCVACVFCWWVEVGDIDVHIFQQSSKANTYSL